MVWQTKETTLGNKPRYVVVLTLVFWLKTLLKNCVALSLLQVIIFKNDRSFEIYGYLISVSFIFPFRRKGVPISFNSHGNHETLNEGKVRSK